VDELSLSNTWWWAGRLDEPDFLARIYPMADLPSRDPRYDSAMGDVWQHRVRNDDWENDWVFTDSRFQLFDGPDEVFLRFLAETVHPVVRSAGEETAALVEMYNQHLRADGYELHVSSEISGRPVYGARSLAEQAPALNQLREQLVDASYLSQQITRMEASIHSDPDLAIGTAKELVETVAKTVLSELGEESTEDDLPRLVRAAARALQLDRESVRDSARLADTIRRILSNLATISNGLAELRNAYGTGHGRPGGESGLAPRHARLAVGSAATLATFLLETLDARTEG
jgi:hypothetical protein